MNVEARNVDDVSQLPQAATRDRESVTEPSADVAPSEVDPKASISTRRNLIDQIDEDVIGLLQRRNDLAAEIQRLRIGAGGPRLSISRETEIVHRYRAGLGKGGAQVAHLVLELSRGPKHDRA